jgi:GNAT superfamily N-acetyltransferase
MPPRQQAPPAQPSQQRPPIGPVVAGVASAAAARKVAAVPPQTAKAALEAFLKTLEAAFALRLPTLPAAIIAVIRKRYETITVAQAKGIAAVELAREREFQRRALERVRRDLPEILRIEDPVERQRQINALLEREAHYGRLREQALHGRVLARAEQEIIRTVSPEGAFWRLSPLTDGRHTPDCIAMANKPWPWSVLKLVHPPLHLNCPCTLHPIGEAVSRGWMTANAPIGTVADARAILGDYPQHGIARDHLEEGRFAELLHPRDRSGRWRDLPGRKNWGALADAIGVPESRPRGVSGQMARAIGEQLDNFAYNGIRAVYRPDLGGSERVSVKFFADADNAGFAQLDVLGDRLELARVFLHDDHQGQGFGSAFTMEAFDAARQQGLTAASLDTVAIGGYAWARAGFVWDEHSSAAALSRQAEADGKFAWIEHVWGEDVAAGLTRFMDTEPSEFEIAMWGREHAIDDPGGKIWPGKAVLLDAQWSGRLEL